MSVSLGIACCFHNERDALAGFIENAQGYFDSIRLVDAGPEGRQSTDGSLDIARSWGIEVVQGNISEGFGVVRTNLVHESDTDWVWVADADERYFPVLELLECSGTEKFPEHKTPNLVVTPTGETYNQGKMLRSLLESADDDQMALVGVRRHWAGFSMRHPVQNWFHERDFQCRCVRNSPHVGFKPEEKMHEKIVDFRTGGEPNMIRMEQPLRGIFWEHFHHEFKKRHPQKNTEDLATYSRLDKVGTENMWLNHQPQS